MKHTERGGLVADVTSEDCRPDPARRLPRRSTHGASSAHADSVLARTRLLDTRLQDRCLARLGPGVRRKALQAAAHRVLVWLSSGLQSVGHRDEAWLERGLPSS